MHREKEWREDWRGEERRAEVGARSLQITVRSARVCTVLARESERQLELVLVLLLELTDDDDDKRTSVKFWKQNCVQYRYEYMLSTGPMLNSASLIIYPKSGKNVRRVKYALSMCESESVLDAGCAASGGLGGGARGGRRRVLLLEKLLRELARALRTRTPEERVVVDARAPEVAALEPRAEVELDEVAVEALHIATTTVVCTQVILRSLRERESEREGVRA